MAPDNAETVPDHDALGDPLDLVPDSTPLRVSSNTAFESGIPPARNREAREARPVPERALTLDKGAERAELALANVTRTEANLGLLVRGLKHLSAGATAARHANTELIFQLEELRTHLSRAAEQEHALRFRMAQLEQLLELIRSESSRERAFLIEQQDLFLVEVLNDHERQLSELRRLVEVASTRRGEGSEVAELIAQRDQAREYATRCERERDVAWQELASAVPGPQSTPAVTLRRPPSASHPAASGQPLATAIGSMSLRSPSGATRSSPAASSRPNSELTESAAQSSLSGYSLAGRDVSE